MTPASNTDPGDGPANERRLRVLLREPGALRRHPRRALRQPRLPQHQHLPVSPCWVWGKLLKLETDANAISYITTASTY